MATYREPALAVSLSSTTGCPEMVVVAPLVSVPPLERVWSSSLPRFVSDASEASSPLVADDFSHLPWNSCAAAAPPKWL